MSCAHLPQIASRRARARDPLLFLLSVTARCCRLVARDRRGDQLRQHLSRRPFAFANGSTSWRRRRHHRPEVISSARWAMSGRRALPGCRRSLPENAPYCGKARSTRRRLDITAVPACQRRRPRKRGIHLVSGSTPRRAADPDRVLGSLQGIPENRRSARLAALHVVRLSRPPAVRAAAAVRPVVRREDLSARPWAEVCDRRRTLADAVPRYHNNYRPSRPGLFPVRATCRTGSSTLSDSL